jgi:hypothetical protein
LVVVDRDDPGDVSGLGRRIAGADGHLDADDDQDGECDAADRADAISRCAFGH